MIIQRDIFPQKGSISESKPQFALPVMNQTASIYESQTFTAGTDFTIPAGAASASVTIHLSVAPILGNNGRTGYKGNSTLVLGGALATTLTTEVSFIANSDNSGGDVTTLTNGQYMVDYEAGVIYGKRVDNGTTGTVAYNYWADITASTTATTSNVNITAVAGMPVQTVGTGILGVGLMDGDLDTITFEQIGTDADNNSRVSLPSASRNSVFNGTTWDRMRSGQVTPTATLTGFANSLPWAVYHSSPTVRTTGQGGPLEANTAGALNVDETMAAQAEDNVNGVFAEAIKPLATATYSWTLFQNLGANATLNVKSTAGSIKSIYCHNLAASPTYIQIHKTATTPAGGAVPALTFLVPAGGVALIDSAFLGDNGYFCTTGIAFAYSTTEFTFTAATAANQVTQIMFI